MSVNANMKVIRELLDGDGITYSEMRLNTVHFVDEGGPSRMKSCEVFCRAEKDLIQIYAYCPIRGEEECMGKLLEYVARANYDLRVGNFEYDVRDGELRYRSTLYTGEEETATPEQLRGVISAAVSTLHTYVDGFVRLNFDPAAEPLDCIEESERRMRELAEEEGEDDADAGDLVDFSSMSADQRERYAQLLCDELLERVGMGEEDAPDEDPDDDLNDD